MSEAYSSPDDAEDCALLSWISQGSAWHPGSTTLLIPRDSKTQVLEEEEYMRRKLFYQDVGQRHYYFMTVGNGEVIDACRKVGLQAEAMGAILAGCSLVAGEKADRLVATQESWRLLSSSRLCF